MAMVGLNLIEAEMSKFFDQVQQLENQTGPELEKMISTLTSFKKELDTKCDESSDYELPATEVENLCETLSLVSTTVNHCRKTHRGLLPSVLKVGKIIDRVFTSESELASGNEKFGPVNGKCLNQAIAEHLYYDGHYDFAESFIAEAGIEVEDKFKILSYSRQVILEALKNHDVGPALDWANHHHEGLLENGSILEFQLHKQAFLSLIQKGERYQKDALQYAQKHFYLFSPKYKKDIEMLMGTLAFVTRNSTKSHCLRSHLFDDSVWNDICEMFIHDFYLALGIPSESSLVVSFTTGCTAIRARSNISQILDARKKANYWNGVNGIPIEIKLATEYQYHSVFVCPILRNEVTEQNPPVLLECGHVISRDALIMLTLLAQGKNSPLKCPYCPRMQDQNRTRAIKF